MNLTRLCALIRDANPGRGNKVFFLFFPLCRFPLYLWKSGGIKRSFSWVHLDIFIEEVTHPRPCLDFAMHMHKDSFYFIWPTFFAQIFLMAPQSFGSFGSIRITPQ